MKSSQLNILLSSLISSALLLSCIDAVEPSYENNNNDYITPESPNDENNNDDAQDDNIEDIEEVDDIEEIEDTELNSPANFNAVKSSTSKIDLNWVADNSQFDSFKISKNNSVLINVDSNINQYSDINVSEGETYYYSIIGIKNNIESMPSTITVVNLVNTAPVITNNENEFTLSTSINPSNPIFNIEVFDAEYDLISYSMNHDNFMIDEVGQIFIKETLDLNSNFDSSLVVTISDDQTSVVYNVDILVELDQNSDEHIIEMTPDQGNEDDTSFYVSVKNNSDHIELSWDDQANNVTYAVYKNNFLISHSDSEILKDYDISDNHFYNYRVDTINTNTGDILSSATVDIISDNQNEASYNIVTTDTINLSVTQNNVTNTEIFNLDSVLNASVDLQLVSFSENNSAISIDQLTRQVVLTKDYNDLSNIESIDLTINYEQYSNQLTVNLIKLSNTQTNLEGANLAFYSGISGNSTAPLIGNHSPSNRSITMNIGSPSDQGSNYGQVVTGYYLALRTGEHEFYLASDDDSQFYISTDMSTNNTKLAAFISGYTNALDFKGHVQSVNLIEGQYYFFKVLHKEGGGGDHLTVGLKDIDTDEVSLVDTQLMQQDAVESLMPTLVSAGSTTIEIPENLSTLKPGETLHLVYGIIDGQNNIDFWEHSTDITSAYNSGELEYTLSNTQSGKSYFVSLLRTNHYQSQISDVIKVTID